MVKILLLTVFFGSSNHFVYSPLIRAAESSFFNLRILPSEGVQRTAEKYFFHLVSQTHSHIVVVFEIDEFFWMLRATRRNADMMILRVLTYS